MPCLAGPEAALPHGSPGDRPVLAGEVLLFDFGAQVEGYRSDMTRTLFVGEPRARDLAIYELVARAQQASIDALEASVRRTLGRGGPLIGGRTADAAARDVIVAAGHGPHFGHGTGHGIGLATHEAPRLSYAAPDDSLPSPTVFSVEPGVYLAGETGVRIEDLIHLDVTRELVERLTHFPRDVIVAARLTADAPAGHCPRDPRCLARGVYRRRRRAAPRDLVRRCPDLGLHGGGAGRGQRSRTADRRGGDRVHDPPVYPSAVGRARPR